MTSSLPDLLEPWAWFSWRSPANENQRLNNILKKNTHKEPHDENSIKIQPQTPWYIVQNRQWVQTVMKFAYFV